MRKLAIIILIFFALPSVLAQNAKPLPATEAVTAFTPQQMEMMATYANQMQLAELQIRAAQAEWSLANERRLGVFKEACAQAGIKPADCMPATDKGNLVGVKRVSKTD